jgi:hypothetical protein
VPKVPWPNKALVVPAGAVVVVDGTVVGGGLVVVVVGGTVVVVGGLVVVVVGGLVVVVVGGGLVVVTCTTYGVSTDVFQLGLSVAIVAEGERLVG